MHKLLLPSSIVFAVCLMGCNPAANKNNPGDAAKKAEDEIKQAWTGLQAAIKAKDADKIWEFLDKNTQSAAEREAKAASQAFGKLADKDKADYEKRVGLTAKELADMTGKLYAKSAVFYGKNHEIPDSKIDKITVTGETGMLYSIEDDGDKVNFPLALEKSQWKFKLETPKVPEQ
jgi:hypothetical protein